ncbi:bifunctional methylenetetrahydrofolate dehydrogenase/methenyltetrahydrofolate cyclohydrolase FolD [Helicobacter sp. 11S02629-2]|uniref:bifunctional methylenetetrahydrofolate dehydrogenase/methenyltetrahydrofolate cyclohydrolase FolD n=1 Tax=Helicobacter sp. 11S02629-2 TaxID=1476195 RepID=UPI000BA62F6C|nr:bifunctional methylenetetrahydrofolate dehydrogenase/methenyltetrahydrofolate cyclohydrolase FolD [Helicobacter sp. 11S02629-2]PAF45340.1 bifunctional methylenetetrahydrofolate dehydrogenase/methenyltetrahydrofolate cyclohydrolase [Helicobacter sp. 11S02629-2]
MTLLDGKKLSLKIQDDITKEVALLAKEHIFPSLAVILVGEDPASQAYVNMKSKACQKVGITSITYKMPLKTTQKDLLCMVENLNLNPLIDGILIQLPLPTHINADAVLNAITPSKDVDGFHPINSGKLTSKLNGFVPATPLGVMELLKYYNIDIKSKDVTIVGESTIVGRPLAMLMLNAGATVTIAHKFTKDLAFFTRQADILCVATGRVGLIKEDMVKEGSVVIDIGITRMEDGSLKGDVDFEGVAPKCSYITPVPGGVGPMTISSLLLNTVKSAKSRVSSKES